MITVVTAKTGVHIDQLLELANKWIIAHDIISMGTTGRDTRNKMLIAYIHLLFRVKKNMYFVVWSSLETARNYFLIIQLSLKIHKN